MTPVLLAMFETVATLFMMPRATAESEVAVQKFDRPIRTTLSAPATPVFLYPTVTAVTAGEAQTLPRATAFVFVASA
jgi:hypothetical protein